MDWISELNPEHLEVIPSQRKRLGTKRGFIAVKSNCSIQSYAPALSPFREKFGLEKIVCMGDSKQGDNLARTDIVNRGEESSGVI